jgi:hypothetical protein
MFKWNNHEKKRKVSTYQALGHILLCDYTLQLAIEHGAYEKNPPKSYGSKLKGTLSSAVETI